MSTLIQDLLKNEALLEMADLMVHHRSLPELFHELAQRLQKVVDFQFLNFSLYDPQRNAMNMHLWEIQLAPELRCEFALDETASGWVWEHQETLLFEDLSQEARFPLALDSCVSEDTGPTTLRRSPPLRNGWALWAWPVTGPAHIGRRMRIFCFG